MRDFNGFDDSGNIRTRPYGSSSLAVSIAIIVIVLALVVIGGVLILGSRGSDDDEAGLAAPTTVGLDLGDGTSTAPQLPTTDDGTSTASNTPSPSATNSATPSNTATVVDTTPTEAALATTPETEVEEPTEPEVIEEPTEEEVPPTSEVSEPSEPAGEPEIGEFGELPPAQLPSGGVSSSLALEYQLAMSLEALPTEATTYLIEWPYYSLDEVQAAVDNLGIGGVAVEDGGGIYRVDGETGTLYVSPSEIVYRSYGEPSGSMPAESDAIAYASEWLSVSGFVTGNIDGGSLLVLDEDSGIAIVDFRPAEPSPILAPTPSATVTVGAGGEIIEARIHWPADIVPSTYGLMSPTDIWKSVQNGNGFLDADLTAVSASAPLSGSATISDYSIAYTLAGGADSQYLVPVIQFHGTALIDQSGEEIPISISVPSVYHQAGMFG